MDLGTGVLLGVASLLAVNRFLLSLPGWSRRKGLFWAVQLLNLLAACFMILHGIPGLQGYLRYANHLIGLVFVFHVVQNNSRLVSARAEERGARRQQDEARREAVQAALRAGGEALQDDPRPDDPRPDERGPG